MVVIRLARGGSNKNPFYHVVVADRRYPRDGRYIERLGYFNPVARGQEKRLELTHDRVDHWIKLGAQPSDRVHRILQEFALIAKGEWKPAPTRAEVKNAQRQNAEKSVAAARKAAAAEAAKQASEETAEKSADGEAE